MGTAEAQTTAEPELENGLKFYIIWIFHSQVDSWLKAVWQTTAYDPIFEVDFTGAEDAQSDQGYVSK